MKTKLQVSVLLTLFLNTSVYAGPTCETVLVACSKAVEAQKELILIKTQTITQAELLLKAQSNHITELEDSRDAWYNSKTLWFVVGLGAGAYLVRR